jgi:hypothetical protein
LVSLVTGIVAIVAGLITPLGGHVALVAGLVTLLGGGIAFVTGLVALRSGVVSIVGGLVPPALDVISTLSDLVALPSDLIAPVRVVTAQRFASDARPDRRDSVPTGTTDSRKWPLARARSGTPVIFHTRDLRPRASTNAGRASIHSGGRSGKDPVRLGCDFARSRTR